jgi:hypothetical protein
MANWPATFLIDDLTDVTITGTPADNELLGYDSGSSLWINQTAAEAGLSATGHTHDHGAGEITGLLDDDHTQYLLASGARALAGAWDMGSQILTNVNIDTGDIATAVTNTEWDAAYTHANGSTGADHSYINQDVGTGASPTWVNPSASTMLVSEGVTHTGDPDTTIAFLPDTIVYSTGGSVRLDASNSGVRLGAANARVTTILDEDAMGSDSATALATQQSIKAYVDTYAPVKALYMDTSQEGPNNSTTETNLCSFTLTGGTLGTANAIKLHLAGTGLSDDGAYTLTIRFYYAGTAIASAAQTFIDSPTGHVWQFEGTIAADGATNAQKLSFQLNSQFDGNAAYILNWGKYGTAAIDSTSNQTVKVTAQWGTAGASTNFLKELGWCLRLS